MPACPPRTTSASASITRTVRPQPEAHDGHRLGLKTAWPGTMSSSGTKRMSVFSGLPQLVSAALVPEIAVSLMKDLRSISKVAREAISWGLLLAVARHAEAHVQIDVALRDSLLPDVAVTRGAFHLRPDMRRVVELHVCLRKVAIDPLPGEVDSLLAHRGDLLDARPIGGDRVVADHAGPDTRQTGNRARRHALVAVLGTGDLLADVHVVRELDRLHRIGPAVHEVVQRGAERWTGRREDVRTLPGQHGRRRRARHVP